MLQKPRPLSLLIAPVFLLMSGCRTETSNSCGVLYKYDEATQKQEQREYDAMKTAGTFPVTREFIDDYGVTRDTIRACGKST